MKASLFLFLLSTTLTSAETKKFVVENFESSLSEWSEGHSAEGKVAFEIKKENDNNFLHGQHLKGTDGKAIYRKVKWNTDEMPFLTWRWRVQAFPTNAMLTDPQRGDAALQIYVVWRNMGRVDTLKYFWALQDPVGTSFQYKTWNPLAPGLISCNVLRMGGKLNEWQTEVRNIKEDFIKAFGKDPPSEARGIGLLTDADATNSVAIADYDDFIALSEAPAVAKAATPAKPKK